MKIKGIAHRGDNINFPENTISAFQAAIDQGFTHVEFDVHLTKDRLPIVFHDFELDRLTNGSGFVKDHTFAELKELTVMESEKIPSLEEVLLFIKGKIAVLLEIKQEGDFYSGIEEKVIEAIEKTDTFDDVRIICFDHFSLQKLRKLHPTVKIGLNTKGASPAFLPFLKEIDTDYLAMDIKFLTPTYENLIKEQGVTLNLFMIDTEEDMRTVSEKYPHAIVTTNQLEKWSDFYLKNKTLLEV